MVEQSSSMREVPGLNPGHGDLQESLLSSPTQHKNPSKFVGEWSIYHHDNPMTSSINNPSLKTVHSVGKIKKSVLKKSVNILESV